MFGYFKIYLKIDYYSEIDLPVDVGLPKNKRSLSLVADLEILELFLLNIDRKAVIRVVLYSRNNKLKLEYYQKFKQICSKYNFKHGIV